VCPLAAPTAKPTTPNSNPQPLPIKQRQNLGMIVNYAELHSELPGTRELNQVIVVKKPFGHTLDFAKRNFSLN